MTFSENLKSVDETAVERNWSPKRVRKLIALGLPTVKIGKQDFVNSDTLDKYLRTREKPAAPANSPAICTRLSQCAESQGRLVIALAGSLGFATALPAGMNQAEYGSAMLTESEKYIASPYDLDAFKRLFAMHGEDILAKAGERAAAKAPTITHAEPAQQNVANWETNQPNFIAGDVSTQCLSDVADGRIFRFPDLVEAGVVNNRSTLYRWIKDLGFPPGFLLGPNSRGWFETDVAQWLSTRDGRLNRNSPPVRGDQHG